MKYVENNVKLRRLIKSMALSFFVFGLFAVSSAFTSFNDGDGDRIKARDSLTDKTGFKSLFSTSYFDPQKPYVSQLNPRAVSFVQEYIRSSGVRLEKMKVWGKPYFDVYDGILHQYNLPSELKYLSVIESDLIAGAVSRAGAVGPWQIMPGEARRMGLRISGRTDERTNFYKSTHAASKILKELYKQFNDWTLVIAAYNCGAGRLRQAIRHSGSRDFWQLQAFLPAETRNHVKRFIGTHYIFEGSGGLTTMTASEVLDYNATAPESADKNFALSNVNTGTVEVTGKYRAAIIAKTLNLDIHTFNKLNPNFDKVVATGKGYTLKLPVEKITIFGYNKHAILDECIKSFLNY